MLNHPILTKIILGVLAGGLFLCNSAAMAQDSFVQKGNNVVIEAEHYTQNTGEWEEVEGRNALLDEHIGSGTLKLTKIQVKANILGVPADLTLAPAPVNVSWGFPNDQATVFAIVEGTNPVKPAIFMYPKGAKMADYTAPAARLVLYNLHPSYSPEAVKLFDNVIQQAAPKKGSVLYAVGNANILNDYENATKSRLEQLGYTVEIKREKETVPADAANRSLVIIGQSCRIEGIQDKFKTADVPVMVNKPGIAAEMGMVPVVAPWVEKPGQSGNAMLIRQGGWGNNLRYAIYFDKPGTYNLWMLGKHGGDGGADEVKVFFNAAEINPNNPDFFELRFPEKMGWTNVAHHKTPANRKTKRKSEIVVPKAGWYNLQLAKGSEPEMHEGKPVIRKYPNWRVDKILLTLDTTEPTGDGPAETLNTGTVKLPKAFMGEPEKLLGQVWHIKNGYAVIEAEAVDHHAHWNLKTDPSGYTGQGYLNWEGPNFSQSVEGLYGNDDPLHIRQGPHEHFLILRVYVDKPGTYNLNLRNIHQLEDGDNDVWISWLGQRGTKEKPISRMGDGHKDGKGFTWLDWGVKKFDLKPGINNIAIGGRSVGFGIDRLVLYLEGDETAKSKALDVSAQQTALYQKN